MCVARLVGFKYSPLMAVLALMLHKQRHMYHVNIYVITKCPHFEIQT